jgi:hypothetical protein
MAKPRGRPISQPERRAQFTFWEIDRLRRLALGLAQQEGLAEETIEHAPQSVPLPLRPAFRLIIGRHTRYLVWPSRHPLPEEKAKKLARIAVILSRKPRAMWSAWAWKLNDCRAKLRAECYGRGYARKADDASEDGLETPSVYVFAGNATPGYLRSLWKALDQWGADKHGVKLPTFRSWRTKLQKRDELSAPRPREQARRVRH